MSDDIRPIGGLESMAICWGIAALAGFGAMALLFFIGDWTVIQSIFAGGLIGFALGMLLMLTAGRSLPAPDEAQRIGMRSVEDTGRADADKSDVVHARHTPAPSPHRTSIDASPISDTQGPNLNDPSINRARSGDGSGVGAMKTQAAAASAPLSTQPPSIGSGVVETAEPKPIGAAVMEDEHSHGTTPTPADEADRVESAPAATRAKVAKDKAAPAKKASVAPKPAAKPDLDADGHSGTEPTRLSAPRDGGADDLKRIKGVGPKLERMLNDMGFYHFDQVANWSSDEVAWVDQNLTGFKGRVSRDDWVPQAKLLASGEETDFSKKVDKGDVY